MIRAALLILLLAASPAAAETAAPSAWLCAKARALLVYAGSETKAIALARENGISDEMIAQARRCRRR